MISKTVYLCDICKTNDSDAGEVLGLRIETVNTKQKLVVCACEETNCHACTPCVLMMKAFQAENDKGGVHETT